MQLEGGSNNLESIIVAFITSGATLIGVIITQIVTFKIQQKVRLQGIEESRIAAAQEKQALNDRLDVIDEKLDLYSEKIDKHNGFEGRIIALETLLASEKLKKG